MQKLGQTCVKQCYVDFSHLCMIGIALMCLNIFLGKVLKANSRQIPDYAVVPTDGFPVDRTVHNIATNGWLV